MSAAGLALAGSPGELLRAGAEGLGPVLIWLAILLMPAAGRLLRAILGQRGAAPGAAKPPRQSLAQRAAELRRQMEAAFEELETPGSGAPRRASAQAPPVEAPRPVVPAAPAENVSAPPESVFAGEGALSAPSPVESDPYTPETGSGKPMSAGFRGLRQRSPASRVTRALLPTAVLARRRSWRAALVQAELLAPPLALRAFDGPRIPRGFA